MKNDLDERTVLGMLSSTTGSSEFRLLRVVDGCITATLDKIVTKKDDMKSPFYFHCHDGAGQEKKVTLQWTSLN